MNQRYIPVREVAAEWLKDPEIKAAYDALEEEFTLAATLINARIKADIDKGMAARDKERSR